MKRVVYEGGLHLEDVAETIHDSVQIVKILDLPSHCHLYGFRADDFISPVTVLPPFLLVVAESESPLVVSPTCAHKVASEKMRICPGLGWADPFGNLGSC